MNVSVALCTYNGSPYLSQQIDSILSQTCTPDEVIVFDDQSNDNTIDILYKYEDEFPNLFNIHQNSYNIGPNKNFERCIRHCSGDVIAICDQDDVWAPTKLEKQVGAIKEQPEPLIYHNSIVTSERLERRTTLWDSLNPVYSENNQDQIEKVRQLVRRNYVQGATILFDTSLKDKFLPIPQNWNYDYWIAVITAISTGIYGLNEPLLLYRQHQNQVVGSKNNTFLIVFTIVFPLPMINISKKEIGGQGYTSI